MPGLIVEENEMSATIIDGKAFAADVRGKVAEHVIEGDRDMSISKPSNIEIVLFVIVMLIGEHKIVLNNSVTP